MSAEPIGTYLPPAHGWTCYHCGETFKKRGEARDHFGNTPDGVAGCIIHAGEERGLLMALRKAEADVVVFRNQRDSAQDEADAAAQDLAAIWRLIPEVKSLNALRCHLDSLQGRVLAAEGTVQLIEQARPDLVETARDALCSKQVTA